jgi:hypothetical protein
MDNMLINSNCDRVIMWVAAAVWVSLLDAGENDDVGRLLVEYMRIWEVHVFIWMKMSYLLFFLSDRRKMIDYSLVFLTGWNIDVCYAHV